MKMDVHGNSMKLTSSEIQKESIRLLREYKDSEDATILRFIEGELLRLNRGLVGSIVRRYEGLPKYVYDDLSSAGLFGLYKAIRNYDETRGAAFTTYASRCISNEVGMYIRKVNADKNNTVSLNSPIRTVLHRVLFRDGGTLEETLPYFVDFDPINTDELVNGVHKVIDRALEHALPQTKKAVQAYFSGLFDQELYGIKKPTQAHLGKHFGITQSVISRRIKRIQRILREELEREGII